MRADNKRHTFLEALVALVALLSIFSTHNAVQAAVTLPGRPTVAAVTSLDPATVGACAQAGKARTKAGCGLVTVLLQEPRPTTKGAAAVTSHKVTCLPKHCAITPVRRQAPRRLASSAAPPALPPCTAQIQAQGAGVPLVVGKQRYLQYKLKLPVLQAYVQYKCWAVAGNKAGFGPASPLKIATLPPSPPSAKPSIVRITASPSGAVVVHVKAAPATPGITGVLVRGRSGNSAMIEAKGSTVGGKEVQLTFKRGQYKEGTLYQLSAHYTNTAPGPATPLLSEPEVEEYLTPSQAPSEGPPGPPAAIALSFLSAATSPVCRDAGAVGHEACTSLTVTVTPPASIGGADITQYMIVCKPPYCTSSQGRRGLRSGMLDPCTDPPTLVAQTPTPTRNGKLQFQLDLDRFNTISYQCNATALNKWGWGAPSKPQQTFTPPERPADMSRRIRNVALVGGQVTVCLEPMWSTSMDADHALIVGKLDDGTEVMSVTVIDPSSPNFCVTAPLPALPNTLIRISSTALKTVDGIVYKSAPSPTRDLLTPPGVPSVTGAGETPPSSPPLTARPPPA